MKTLVITLSNKCSKVKNKVTMQQTYYILQSKQKRNIIVVTYLSVMIFATVGLDFLYAQSQNTSFYISESLLFSCFWLLFLPLLSVQLELTRKTKKISYGLLIAALATTIHLFTYPALVWLLSKIFYYHTFPYWQTFNFGLREHFIKSVITYSLPLLIIAIYKNKIQYQPLVTEKKEEFPIQSFITSIIVSDSNNKKTVIETNDILYFSANSPYINIYLNGKKYLQSETLKSISEKLNIKIFIRVHKSTIVNIQQVQSYTSRLNGDYDVTMSDGSQLRVSRNFAFDFKKKFQERHRFTTK